MPRKKFPTDLRSLARAHTELAIKTLAGIVSQEAMSAAARVQAAVVLLDRGWGKPPKARTGETDRDIRIVIRQISEEADSSGKA